MRSLFHSIKQPSKDISPLGFYTSWQQIVVATEMSENHWLSEHIQHRFSKGMHLIHLPGRFQPRLLGPIGGSHSIALGWWWCWSRNLSETYGCKTSGTFVNPLFIILFLSWPSLPPWWLTTHGRRWPLMLLEATPPRQIIRALQGIDAWALRVSKEGERLWSVPLNLSFLDKTS